MPRFELSNTETTAHTLGATLGFLAYYPEIQEEVYEHILSVVGKNRDPVASRFPRSKLPVN